jgi:hypothetical protein
MTKLQLARQILKGMSEQSVYMLTFPNRGPQRYRQVWTHEDGARQLAATKTKEQLQKWADSESPEATN